MTIYRCNKCAFVSENTQVPIGAKANCERCSTPSMVFDTVYYVEKLVERYRGALREIDELKVAAAAGLPAPQSTQTTLPPAPAGLMSVAEIDIHNTPVLATSAQHQPLKDWFAAQQIEAIFDPSLVDTSGFFDDAARLIGRDFALFGELIDRIRYAYRNSHSGVNIELASLSQKETQAITTLCRQLYDHTFFSRYHYQKPEKIVRLGLQTAPAVRQFFDGGWLEWFAFIEVMDQLKRQNKSFSCARGVKVVFANEDLHELDVIVLSEGQMPVCIECKSGEFRRDIDKYLRLRKRLNLDRSRFIICATSLSDEQARGLNAMYELSFVNLASLPEKLATLL